MNIKSRLITVLMAALFASATLFSGTAMADHCEHQSDPVETYDEYDQ